MNKKQNYRIAAYIILSSMLVPASFAEYEMINEEWSVNQEMIIEMPPAYSLESQDVSLCYAFTAANLMNQMLLSISELQYTPVSILDLAVFGSGMKVEDVLMREMANPRPYFDDLGSTYKPLIYAKLTKKISTEQCAPFE